MNYKRMLGILALLSILGLATSAKAGIYTFTDVKGNEWYIEHVEPLVQSSVVQGYPDGSLRPNQTVTIAEFIKMIALVTVMEEPEINHQNWYEPYVTSLVEHKIISPNQFIDYNKPITRGDVAKIVSQVLNISGENEYLTIGSDVKSLLGVAITDQSEFSMELRDAIFNTFYNGIITGYPDGSFQYESHLNRAEAITILHRIIETEYRNPFIVEPRFTYKNQVYHLGDNVSTIIEVLGEPNRIDANAMKFEWYVYNQDYSELIYFGIKDQKIVGVFSNAKSFSYDGFRPDQSTSSLVKLKGQMEIYDDSDERIHLPLKNAYVNFYLDIFDQTISSIYIMNSNQTYYGVSYEPRRLEATYEYQILDLVNAARVKRGIPVVTKHSLASVVAKGHSDDMGSKNYFDHTNLAGLSPFDRMKNAGITYAFAGENIAAGYNDGIEAHEGWMNSGGHRRNILNENYKSLGVGVVLGKGIYSSYYTQNFVTIK